MCHTSPSTFAVWSLLSTTLFAFLLSHLWAFDRFRCLRWGSGSGSGAFKRVMTYSYLLSVPLIWAYSVGFTYIKYTEGWFQVPGTTEIIPKPYQLWAPVHQRMVFPLYMLFSVAWGLEIVTHLEELCFWLFLLRSSSGGSQTSWFRSPHFKLWAVGSILGAVGIPLVTVFKRQNPLEAEAWTFLIASSGSLLLTLLFLPVLFGFPAFLRKLKAEGTQRRVVLRLCHFHDINIIRVCFRFVFVLPLFVLGLDGVMPRHVVNESLFWTDILAFASALGCIASSVMTLLIFFPRDTEAEAGYRERTTHGSVGPMTADEKRGPTPARPPRPDSSASFETPVLTVGTTWPDASRGVSAYSASGYSGSHLDARVVPGVVVEADGAAFQLFQHPDDMHSTAGLMKQDHDLLAPEDMPHVLPPNMPIPSKKRTRPTQQWAAQPNTYPPNGLGRFGGQSAPEVNVQDRLSVHPMVRHYRSPIDLIDSYYHASGNYV